MGMSVKFRFSCGITLLVCSRCYPRIDGAAQEGIDEAAEAKQVLQRTDDLRALCRVCDSFEVCPCRRDQRLTPVGENQNELQGAAHARVPEDLQRLSFERMMRAGDGHSLREVLTVGSVWWLPSIRFRTPSFWRAYACGSWTDRFCS